MAGLGLVHSLYRAHRAVVPATAWHLVLITYDAARWTHISIDRTVRIQFIYPVMTDGTIDQLV